MANYGMERLHLKFHSFWTVDLNTDKGVVSLQQQQ